MTETDPRPVEDSPQDNAADAADAEDRGGDQEARPVRLRTGADGPVDPEDLAMANGLDPTPEHVERYRRQLEEEGAAVAVEKTVP